MAEKPEKADKPQKVSKELRIAAQTLSGLMTTPVSELESFRKKRLGRSSTVALERLESLRFVLLELAANLQADDEDGWGRLAEVHRVLARGMAEAPPAPTSQPREPAEAPTSEPELEPTEKGPAIVVEGGPAPPPLVGETPTGEPLPASVRGTKRASPWVSPVTAAVGAKPSAPPSRAPTSPPMGSSGSMVPTPLAPPQPVPPPPLVGSNPDESTNPTAATPAQPDEPRAGDTEAPPASEPGASMTETPEAPLVPVSAALPASEHAPDSVTGDPSVGTRAPTVLPFGDAQSTPPPAANRQHPTWGLPFQPVASQPQAKRPNPPYYPRPPVDEEVTAAVSIPLPSAPSLAGSLAGSLPGSLPGPGQPLPGAGTVTLQTGAELAHVQVPGSNLSLTTYAALCATCGAFPARVAETYLKFGIADHEARRAIDEAWQAHFQRQPEARRLWQALFLKFRAWLVQYCGV